jgi:hypothetical protein
MLVLRVAVIAAHRPLFTGRGEDSSGASTLLPARSGYLRLAHALAKPSTPQRLLGPVAHVPDELRGCLVEPRTHTSDREDLDRLLLLLDSAPKSGWEYEYEDLTRREVARLRAIDPEPEGEDG